MNHHLSISLTTALLIAADARPDEPIDFDRDVRPILADKCFACHGPDANTRSAGLRLDLRDGATHDLGGRAAVVPGEPDRSELIRRVSHDGADRMPPEETGKSVSPREREVLAEWIRQGAEWADHWAYQPPTTPTTPEVRDAAWPLDPIDRFILGRLERSDIRPSPEAPAEVLSRRLHFDLIGLPPAAGDAERFAVSAEPDAHERAVDRLLASPHFGERLAAYWLDLVRYADTVGYHGDQPAGMSLYRDYVIEAFNANMPFDRFTREQLAGDLLPEPTRDQVIASGYNRLGMMSAEGGAQPEEYLAKYAADRVRTAGSVWLGSTVGCAECHDHKFDPITQKDFYSMAAFFADVQERGVYAGRDWGAKIELPSEKLPELLAPIDAELGELMKQPESEELKKKVEALTKRRQAVVEENTRTSLITVSVPPRPVRLLPRGDWMDKSGPVVEPATPHFLPARPTEGRATRLDLADWFTADDNPLTARVFANRMWKQFFGRGLSRVLDDLGAQGEAPTHPALLDSLALDFRQGGWDVKDLVRRMVTSRTYRQSSMPRPDLDSTDPTNRLLARQARFRLDAELIRDNALTVSGLLVRHLGGDSVKPYQPEGLYRHLNFPPREYVADAGEKQYRRGVYTHWQRQFLHPALKAFDAPAREECSAERPRSNTPLGALVLLNDPSYVEAARVFAARVLTEGGTDTADRVRWMVRRALSREPSEAESEILAGLVDGQRRSYGADPKAAAALLAVGDSEPAEGLDPVEHAAWTAACRAVFNMHEMITRN